jgi:PAS domain S-box-containing protein
MSRIVVPSDPGEGTPRLAYERAALQAASLDAVFVRACRVVAHGASTAGVLWTRYGEVTVRARHGGAADPGGRRLSDAVARGVVETELPRTVHVDADSAGLAGHPRDFTTGMFVPVRAGGWVVGCIAALADGPHVWTSAHEALLVDVAGMVGQSVEDWVRAERGEAGWLRERGRELAVMFESARMGTFDWDVPSDSLVFAGRFQEHLNARRGGFVGGYRDWLARVHAQDRDRVDRGLQHALASGEPYRARYRFVEDDGRGVRWLETRAQVVLDERSVPTRVLGVSFDLSGARTEPPADVAGTTGILHSFNVLDGIRDAVLLTEAEPLDGGGPRVVAVNHAFTRMTGFGAEDIVGATPRILQGPDTEPHVRERIRAALAAWEPLRCRITNYRKGGDRFLVELDIVPIADSTGWYTHWVSVQREVLPTEP